MTSTVKSRQSAAATAAATAAAAAAAAATATATATATADLMHGAATGDRQAWEELVGRYTGMLYAIARSHGLDPATSGDAVQTTWLRLVEHLGTLREPSAVGGWLATTVRRQCLVLVRNRRREPPVEQTEDLYPLDTDHSPEDEVVARDRDERVRAAFHRLPVKDRRLLACLMVSARCSYADASARLDMPVGSIGPTRARSLQRLRRELAAAGINDAMPAG
jgi:RNA polymerase sigma factor (sigma-70 family)